MWKVRGADRIAQTETKVDLSRRSIQWKTYKNSSFSWKEVSGYIKAGDFQDTGTSKFTPFFPSPPTLLFTHLRLYTNKLSNRFDHVNNNGTRMHFRTINTTEFMPYLK